MLCVLQGNVLGCVKHCVLSRIASGVNRKRWIDLLETLQRHNVSSVQSSRHTIELPHLRTIHC